MSLSISEKLLEFHQTLIAKFYVIGAWLASGTLTIPGIIGADGRDFSERAHYFFSNLTVMELLGFVAMLLLIIERCFVVWSRYREWRRSHPGKSGWLAFGVIAVGVAVWAVI